MDMVLCRIAAQFVLVYASVDTVEFGGGLGAVIALRAKYRLDGESEMHGLHNQLANL